jgi:hypothetical protein
MRVLFIAKLGQTYSKASEYAMSSGLFNSAKFMVDMLNSRGVDASVVHVVDNNDIDREVTQSNPDVAIIEALWVTPSKFDVLTQLHPNVQWVIRMHSEVPFLAQEGVAMSWLFDYLKKPNVFVAFNSTYALRDFMRVSGSDKLLYLPNYYPGNGPEPRKYETEDLHELHVGCFGAIRPLKNQLIQAMAAVQYANLEGKHLNFHMNTSRVEGGAEVLNNIRSLFSNSPHLLVEHLWLPHSQFCHLLSLMDLVMCVSLSETFCIVAADAVSLRVPIVVSSEIPWASRLSQADPTSMSSILDAMYRVMSLKRTSGFLSRLGLSSYNSKSVDTWLQFLNK